MNGRILSWLLGVAMLLLAAAAQQDLFAQELRAGDADQDLDFDQDDLLRVSRFGRYITEEPATWGEGDWDGAPGGQPGAPPPGDGVFDSLDIMAALHQYPYPSTICTFVDCFTLEPGLIETGNPYRRLESRGKFGDERLSIAYYSETGEVVLDYPAGTELAALSLKSSSGIFKGEPGQDVVCCWSAFDIFEDHEFFKVTFGSSFGSISLGEIVQPMLPPETVLQDLSVAGVFPFHIQPATGMRPGERLKAADLIYVPPVPLQAGDASQDFAFDQGDLVQVLQAGKYLSSQHANWEQGDWNGAPGGRLGRPPIGDGVFDQEDVMAALRNGHYLQESYAAFSRDPMLYHKSILIVNDAAFSQRADERLEVTVGGVLPNVGRGDEGGLTYTAVPEPRTFTALSLGLLTLLAVVCRHASHNVSAPMLRHRRLNMGTIGEH